jgi:hypothetical protein
VTCLSNRSVVFAENSGCVIGTDYIGSCKSILELNSLVFFAGFRFSFLNSFYTHTIAVTISFDTSTGELNIMS